MITVGKQLVRPRPDINSELESMKGELDDYQIKTTLAPFLYYNPGVAWWSLTKMKLFDYQELVIRAWMIKNFNMLIASRGGAKTFMASVFCGLMPIFQPTERIVIASSGFRRCALPDTYVYSKDGMIQIKDTTDNVWADKQIQRVTNKWLNNKEKTLRIRTYRDYIIEGLLEHRIKIFNPLTFDFEYKHLSELNVDDILPIRHNMQIWGNQNPVETFSFSKDKYNSRLSTNFDKDSLGIYYLIGLIIGDGYISKTEANDNINITNIDQEIVDSFYKIMGNLLPENQVYRRKDRDQNEYRVSSVNLVELFRHFGYNLDWKALTKEIPKEILKCPKEKIAAFLQGLFDTDGTIYYNKEQKNRCEVKLATSSINLARQVQMVLLNFGVLSSICTEEARGEMEICGVKTYGNTSYGVKIYGYDSLKRFSDQIGFRLTRKQNKLAEFLTTSLKASNGNATVIPGIGRYLKTKYSKGFKHFRDNLTFHSIKKILRSNLAKKLDQSDLIKIDAILNSNYYFDSVRHIEESEGETIDIEVENEHCYFGNGFINHNSRAILDQLNLFIQAPASALLRQSFPKKLTKRNDEYRLDNKYGGGITALPLNENVRGQRAGTLIIDEALLVPQSIYDAVLFPFLLAKSGIQDLMKIKDMEDRLIQNGMMEEKDRETSESLKRIILLSSASYQFEFLYELFEQWITKVLGTKIGDERKETLKKDDKLKGSRCVMQLSYEILPKELIDETIANEAKERMSDNDFLRELMAQFIKDSGGFFRLEKMERCTIKPGATPCIELVGDPNGQYIISVDTNLSESNTADHFSMKVGKLDYETKKVIVVHSFAKAGRSIGYYINYFYYLFTKFKPEMVIGDKTGGAIRFFNTCNESVLFKENSLKINTWEAKFDDETEYQEALRLSKLTYNKEDNRIILGQQFTKETVGQMNDNLQVWIDRERVWFASNICDIPNITETVQKQKLISENVLYKEDKDDTKERMVENFLDDLDVTMKLTKTETALIEVDVTPLGVRQFDLPLKLRRIEGPNRPRKDSYTCLLMLCWAAKIRFDMAEFKAPVNSFAPMMIGR